MADLSIFITSEPLEKVSLYTPFGIRFWDLAENRAVVNGLEVIARPPGQPQLTRRAYQTPSGIYAFHNLPGMRSLENSDPDLPAGVHPLGGSPPSSSRFIIEVQDRLNHFLPVTFQVDLPYRGIYPTQSLGSPPGSGLPGFLLFSDPSRPALSDLAVVRGQLLERPGIGQLRPAEYAVVEVEPEGGPVYQGIANKLGNVSVMFPYPQFATAVHPPSPPPGPPETRFQSWEVSVRVRFGRSVQTLPDEFAAQPSLRSLLTQPLAGVWQTLYGPAQPQIDTRLFFSQPLLLQTDGVPELWIE